MAAFSTKAPGTGAPKIASPKNEMNMVRYQHTVRPPNRFPHLTVSRRDYSKPEMGAEQPLGVSEGAKSSFGSTGLTGET